MNAATREESLSVEVVDAAPNAIEAISSAEINQQISTAKKYPRSMAVFIKRATDMVSLDEETAESCIYRRPVGKKKNEQTGKWEETFAEGMSIRLAEIVGACYGNLRVGAMLVEQSDRQVRARGYAHDLESNFASTSEVVESTVDKNGNPYSERMRVVLAKAVLAKARRDATFSVVPRALCKPVEILARKIAIGDATTLERRRAAAMQWVASIGVPPARVFAALGVNGEADIGIEHLTTLTGLKTAIKDGEITRDEAFPPLADGETPARAQSTATQQAGRPPYPADKFANMKGTWAAQFAGGIKPADLIAMLKGKYSLTAEQEQEIEALAVPAH
jgi:hypothetical protein